MRQNEDHHNTVADEHGAC